MTSHNVKAVITWGLKEPYYIQLQREFPEVRFELCEDSQELEQSVRDAEIVYAGLFKPQHFAKAERLKWLQLNGHGANAFLFPGMAESDVLMTNSGQVHAIPIAEHVFALMLNHSRKITELKRGQNEGRWVKQEIYSSLGELYGKTAAIIGMGNIGTEVAKRAKAFEMKVLGVRRNAAVPHAYADEMFTLDRLEDVLRQADYVIVTLPATPDTTGLFGKNEWALLKRDAYLINVGRGDIFVEDDLIDALRNEQFAGAGLDVFCKEPLPDGSPFYALDNVMVTPHLSGATPAAAQRQHAIFAENLRRFLSGEPLMNLVDKRAGY